MVSFTLWAITRRPGSPSTGSRSAINRAKDSTQVPLDVIQSMELITGAPPAEFGDKTSLIVNAVTRSGLGQKTTGSLMGQWGSFATYSEEATLGFGNKKAGNFLAFNALRSGRFLDT